jgi:hypothetical protein
MELSVTSENRARRGDESAHNFLYNERKEWRCRIDVASYNCHNFKASHVMINKIAAQHDVTFVIEHWLAKEEEHIVSDMSTGEYKLVFMSDYMLAERRRGRPFGGMMWLIDNKHSVDDHTQLSEQVSKLTLSINGENGTASIVVLGVWLKYDDNSQHSRDCYWLNLNILAEAIKECNRKGETFVIVGDWNADVGRGRRFDELLREFIQINNLVAPNGHMHTYRNGNYEATLDYAMVQHEAQCIHYQVLQDPQDVSDHRPISIACHVAVSPVNGDSDPSVKRDTHRFNWNDAEFLERYRAAIDGNLSEIEKLVTEESDMATQDRVSEIYRCLCKALLKSARQAERMGCLTDLQANRKKRIAKVVRRDEIVSNLTAELSAILQRKKARMVGRHDRTRARIIRKAIRRREKDLVKELNCCKAGKINKLFKLNRTRFWAEVTKFRQCKSVGCSTGHGEFVTYYKQAFTTKTAPECGDDIRQKHELIEEKVWSKINELADNKMEATFTEIEVQEAVRSLKRGKAYGYDGVANEMLIHANSTRLISCITWMLRTIIEYGVLPDEYNISIVCPIPKAKVNQNGPADFRPLSISSCFAILLEKVIFNGTAEALLDMHPNQFGYRKFSSCKHAYFVANETVQRYNSGGSSVHIASLDAEKAFDSLWRNGLFYKLAGKIPDVYWRALVNYYRQSKISVRFDGRYSELISIDGGVKQGGILSPYLFNYYINDLLEECVKLDVGCRIGRRNVSALAYCDDIGLLATNSGHLGRLLKTCEEYSIMWKLRFNALKSTYTVLRHPNDQSKRIAKVELYGKQLPHVESFVYLGLPVGDHKNVEKFVEEKFRKTCRAYYSLSGIGCRVNGLEPYTNAFVYRTYCQPIVCYGLEMLHIRKSKLKDYDSTQATLIKNSTGLSKYVRTTPLINALKVRSITHLYYRMKIAFLKQLKLNQLTSDILNDLIQSYKHSKIPEASFVKQVSDTGHIIGKDVYATGYNACLDEIDKKFRAEDEEMVRRVGNLCKLMFEDRENSLFYKNILYSVLSAVPSSALR